MAKKGINISDGQGTSFSERVRYISQKVGGIEKLSTLAEISKRVISQYISGQSEPTRPRIIAMANAGDVSVEWLATGLGEKSTRPVNDILLANVVDAVKSEMEKQHVIIPTVRFAKIISALYDELNGSDKQDDKKSIEKRARIIINIIAD